MARPVPGCGSSVASPAGVGGPGVILASLAPYLGRRAYIQEVITGRLLLHSCGHVGAGYQDPAPGFVESRGSAERSRQERWMIAGGR